MGSPARRVAITGASGYCAAGLLDRLEAEDGIEAVLAIDVRPPRAERGAKVVFHRHDVSEPMGDLLRDYAIDSVVHLAYLMRPGHDRTASRKVNVGGTANVLKAVEQAGVQRLLYLSSSTVYGAHHDNPPLLTEDAPLRPVKGFQYSEGKVRSEEALAELVQRSPQVTACVLRACPVMGPGADNFVSRALSRPFLVAVRGCDPPMQFLHEDDLADAMLLCLLGNAPGVYNLAGEGGIRWSDMARSRGRRLISLPAAMLYGLTDATWALRLQGDSPACGLDFIRHRWSVSTEKIERDLGFAPRYSSAEAWNAFAHRTRDPMNGAAPRS
jgi:UDP-glucose 4-epimerase